MDDFEYSDEALNVISSFYEADKVLYVEGDDDVLFWECMLEKFNIENVKVKSVDGVRELNKYVNKIESDRINSLVARDRDLSFFNEDVSKENVLYTYGHSIENSLIHERSVCKLIRTYGRLGRRVTFSEDFRGWLQGFSESIREIALYEIAKEYKGNGLLVLGDNCSRFMVSNNSPFLSDEKIRSYLQENNIPEQLDDVLDYVEPKIYEEEREVVDFVKGHFLFSACLRYVNNKIFSISGKKINNDGFFTGLLIGFDRFFDNDHAHYDYYSTQVDKVRNSLFK